MADRILIWSCWMPGALLVWMLWDISQAEGWGAWAAASALILPVSLSGIVAGWGVLRLAMRWYTGRPLGGSAAATTVAAIPLLWMWYRMLIAS